MTDNLDIFRRGFLEANTWQDRKDGVPLDLLDNLSPEELIIAEIILLKNMNLADMWPIIGLGHIKSKNSLPKLYQLLVKSKKNIKVTIAHSIYQICQDPSMIDIVLNETPKITNQYDLVDVIYYLPDFKNSKIDYLLNQLRNHKKHLVAYNATSACGLSTEEVIKRFREQKPSLYTKIGWWLLGFSILLLYQILR